MYLFEMFFLIFPKYYKNLFIIFKNLSCIWKGFSIIFSSIEGEIFICLKKKTDRNFKLSIEERKNKRLEKKVKIRFRNTNQKILRTS